MSDLGFNKIAFCVLGTSLMLIGLNEASHAFFHQDHHEREGYAIDIPEAATAAGPGEVEEGPRDYYALISAANVEAGKQVAQKCVQCHKFEQGAAALQGPPLFGVLGRDIASVSGFNYSSGPGSLTNIEGVWDYEHLDHFIEAPKKYAPRTAMNFIGVKKQEDRANLIAYLRTLATGEPMPLPPPLPAQETAPVEAAAASDPSAPEQGEAGAPGEDASTASAEPTADATQASDAPAAQPDSQPAPGQH